MRNYVCRSDFESKKLESIFYRNPMYVVFLILWDQWQTLKTNCLSHTQQHNPQPKKTKTWHHGPLLLTISLSSSDFNLEDKSNHHMSWDRTWSSQHSDIFFMEN